jgi:O-antigen ligase
VASSRSASGVKKKPSQQRPTSYGARRPSKGPEKPEPQRQRGTQQTSIWGPIDAWLSKLVPREVSPKVLYPLGGLWLILLLLLGLGALTSWTFMLFAMVTLACAWFTGIEAYSVARGKEGFRAARSCVVMALAFLIPVFFDPHASNVFDLPKYTILVIGALVLFALGVLGWIRTGKPPRWRSGMQWLLLAWLLWTVVTTLTSVDPRLSTLGFRGSYDGLYATLAFMTLSFFGFEAFEVGDIGRVLGVMAFGAGTVAAFYGLLQLHDMEVRKGPRWDFVHWVVVPFHNVFSTLGNPNHLGGYISIILPSVIVLGIVARKGAARVASGILVVLLLMLLLQTAARGAWVATIAALVVLAVAMWPEIKKRPLIPIGAVSLAALAGAVLFLKVGSAFVGGKIASLFNSNPSSAVAQRFDLWGASLHIAEHHPLTGTGPDSFALVFPRYENASWIKYLGFTYVANGAHDIFMNVLADRGFVGLAIFVAIVIFVGLRSLGALRRLRAQEGREGLGGMPTKQRWLLGASVAGAVGYIVQAIFNVQQIALSSSWWLLVGLVCVVTVAAGVPDTLSPARLLSLEAKEEAPPVKPSRNAARAAKGSKAKRGSSSKTWALGISSVVAVFLVGLLSYGADGPWRASQDYWAASKTIALYEKAVTAHAPSEVINHYAQRYFSELQAAQKLDPWEGHFAARAGVNLAVAATKETQPSQAKARLENFRQAEVYLTEAVKADPIQPKYRYFLAQVLVSLARLEPSSSKAYLAKAKSEEAAAVRWSPKNPKYSSYLERIKADLRAVGA